MLLSGGLVLTGFLLQSGLCATYDICLQKALGLLEENELESAGEVLLRTLELRPEYYEPHFYLGVYYARQSRYESALDHLNAALLAKPDLWQGYEELAATYYLLEDYENATTALRKALTINPESTYGLDLLATILYLQDDLRGALGAWNQLGEPKLGEIFLRGVEHTDLPLVLSVLRLNRFEVITYEDLEQIRSRLLSLGVFTGVSFSLVPRTNLYDLEITAPDTKGLGSFNSQLISNAATGLAHQTLGLSYKNAFSRALNFQFQYRWDVNRTRLVAGASLPAYPINRGLMFFRVTKAEERWSLGNDLESKVEFDDVTFTYVNPMTGHTDLQLIGGFNRLDETQSENPQLSKHVTLGMGLKRSLLDASTSSFSSAIRLSYTSFLPVSSSNGANSFLLSGDFSVGALHQSGRSGALNGLMTYGYQGQSTPLNRKFILGVGLDDPLLLRAHATTAEGIKGHSPIAPHFVLLNLDFKRHLFRKHFFDIDYGLFVDSAQLAMRFNASRTSYTDLGITVEIGFPGFVKVEYVFGYGISDQVTNSFLRVSF